MSDTRTRILTPATIAILTVVAVGVVIGSLLPGTEATEKSEGYEFSPGDYSVGTPVITSKRALGGFSLFGVTFREPDYQINVMVAVPEDCADQMPGLSQRRLDSGCPDRPGMDGPTTISGRTATGEVLLTTSIETSAACYSAIELGTAWPANAVECTDQIP